jgi:hypothetical protein
VERLSRELAVPIFKFEQWRQKADAALDGALKEREADATSIELDAAMKRIGELSMENELLRVRDAIRVSRKRLLRVMREHALLSPHCARPCQKDSHDRLSCTRFLWAPICPRRDRNDDVQHGEDRSLFIC